MRKRKFKVWDKRSQNWVNHVILDESLHSLISNDSWVLFETIGVKDSHDNDIYVGDIIELYEIHYDENDEEIERTISKHEVVWGGSEYPAYHLKPSLDSDCNDFSSLIHEMPDVEFRVIGNIFADEDLMKFN